MLERLLGPALIGLSCSHMSPTSGGEPHVVGFHQSEFWSSVVHAEPVGSVTVSAYSWLAVEVTAAVVWSAFPCVV